MTVNAIFLIGYALGQVSAPQFWKAKYAPRYRLPWGIIIVRRGLAFYSITQAIDPKLFIDVLRPGYNFHSYHEVLS